MLHIYLRRRQTERTCFQVRSEMLLKESEDFLVRIALVAAHVNGEGARVGNHVVLCTGIDNGDRLLHGSQQVRLLRELPFREPLDVLHRMVDGIVALIPCRMTCLPMSGGINHHETFFSNSWLHARRFTHDGKVNLWQQGQHTLNAVLA